MRIPNALLACGLVLLCAPAPAHAASAVTFTAGLEVSSFALDPGFPDPYGAPAGGGAAFDVRIPLDGIALILQARLSGWGFPPLVDGFADSFMMITSFGAGLGFGVALGEKARLEAIPFGRAGQYVRRFVFLGLARDLSRPVVSAGCELRLRTDSGMVLGMTAADLVLLEQETRHAFWWSATLGLEIPAGGSQ